MRNVELPIGVVRLGENPGNEVGLVARGILLCLLNSIHWSSFLQYYWSLYDSGTSALLYIHVYHNASYCNIIAS